MSRRSKALRYYRSAKPVSPLKKFIRSLIKLLIVLFILYHLVFLFFVQTYTLDTEAMSPTLEKGDHIVSTPMLFGPSIPFTSCSLPSIRRPQRGDAVTVVRMEGGFSTWYGKTADIVLRFFTLQKLSLRGNGGPVAAPAVQVKRIIGIPGDTVKLENYRVQVRPEQTSVYLDEQEIMQKDYQISVPEQSSSTVREAPFSGNMPEIELKQNEYLLLSDNRAAGASSWAWVPTRGGDICSLILFRYRLPF